MSVTSDIFSVPKLPPVLGRMENMTGASTAIFVLKVFGYRLCLILKLRK
jgi:hypothetical protein